MNIFTYIGIGVVTLLVIWIGWALWYNLSGKAAEDDRKFAMKVLWWR
jgi:uncharacterized membrane protein YukC